MQADYVEAEGAHILVRRFDASGGLRVLYWHGGGGASEEIAELGPALAAAGHSVYAPDAPGYGGSPALATTRYQPSSMGRLAVALINALGIPPVVWIGSSWGASIGIHVAVRAPSHVAALALLDGGYLEARDDPDFDPSLDLAARTAELRARLEQGETWEATPEVIAGMMQETDAEPPSPLLPALAATGTRILLLRATEPPEYEQVRRRALERFRTSVPSAEVIELPAGHTLLTDAGPEVRRILLGWLA